MQIKLKGHRGTTGYSANVILIETKGLKHRHRGVSLCVYIFYADYNKPS